MKTPMVDPSPTETDREWRRPGPGSWVLDHDHTGPTPSRPVRDLLSECSSAGMAEAFAMLGAPLATMQVRFLNGRFYRRMAPVVGEGRDAPPPPSPALWLGARVHPTLRRRERTARRALQDRVWLQELARWEDEWRPQIVAANERFGRVDPAMLDDAGLHDHLVALWEHLRWTTALHFRLHGTDVGPIGLLLARTDRFAIPRSAVFDSLAGASPSTSEPAVAAATIRAMAHTGDAELPDHIDAPGAVSPEVRRAVEDFVLRYGWRLTTGYDLTDRTLIELPGVLDAMLQSDDDRTPGATTLRDAKRRGEAATHALLEMVPVDEREEVATAIDDARRCYGLRDENGPITFEWPGGLLRRGLLEAASRLVDRGSADHIDHVFDATVDEVADLLDDGRQPDSSELRRRHGNRMSWASLDPPESFGPPEAFPPPWALPIGMRTLTSAIIAVMELLGAEAAGSLHGLGVGTTAYVGTARIVSGADEAFAAVEPGDVLVTTATVPTFNAVLAIAGALVVEEGGLLSHAAVIAREMGFPAVIGAADATTLIPDGATVEVDPVAGVVRVVS